ncbi:hypothetical protein MSSAC_1237 [Methanosarcina siciliae C2J]|uniref:Uncharacterized protein n=3 Tax=Methanosarcina siciliae TaxID=38027 RepID=A0A0E3PGF1_9EURY|nr:hypothetical protein [Methanosarcina siciliae]AKB29576.1 hypothetical protein MSSIT_2857 [Methanosarcina siciliae T4/M]AKB33513.1 hypothetical protein MSSIH_2823 [Methanosarcina siciliae HI350]AKB35827.1 hypothetical protein MSSAC_1237 [Methanosarcina siciliae C2J]
MEGITVEECIHLLSRIEDKARERFWKDAVAGKYPIIDLQGNMGYSFSDQDGMLFVRNDFVTSTYEVGTFVFGSFFLPDTIQELLSEDKVLLLGVYRKKTRNLLLAKLDAESRYMLDLPRGLYSFFVLVLDARAGTPLASKIYAAGLPGKENLNKPELEKFFLEHPTDIRDFLDSSPVEIKGGGPFYLTLILIDASLIPDCPEFFSELLQEDEVSSSL